MIPGQQHQFQTTNEYLLWMPSSKILLHNQRNLAVLDVLRSLINIIFEMPLFVNLCFKFINTY